MLIKNIATFAQTYTPDATSQSIGSIFAGAGQSNGYYGGHPTEWPADTLNPAVDVSGGHVWQLANATSSTADYGDLLAATEPLKNPVPVTGAIGFSLPFARDYYQPAHPSSDVLLVPYYISDTGFSDNRWNPGDDLFTGLCSALGVALAKCPGAPLRALLWMQGEKEAIAGWTQSQYATAFDAFAAAFRAEFGEVPIILGGMRPGWVAANAARAPVQAAIADAPNRLSNVRFANPSSSPVIGGTGTGVHYSASEMRALGGRFYDAWLTL